MSDDILDRIKKENARLWYFGHILCLLKSEDVEYIFNLDII